MNSSVPNASPGAYRRAALSSSLWTTVGFGTSQVLRLASNIVLAALLFQQAFALMAIISSIIQGLTMFSDIGIGPNIVQSKRGDDPDFLDTAWTLQVMRGAAISAIAAGASWPIAAFYAQNDPLAWELLWLLPIVSLGVFIQSFQSVNLHTASRHMQLARPTLIELGAQLVSLVTMLGLAWATRSVLALAAGNFAGAAATCLGSHWFLRGHKTRFRWDPAIVKELLRFGRWVFLSTVITFFAMQLDKLIFARLFPLDRVGVYNIAAGVATLPTLLMSKVLRGVAFPLYSRILEQTGSIDRALEKTKLPLLAGGGLLTALLIAGSSSFVAAAYDARYAEAAWFLPLLVVGGWFAIVDSLYSTVFLSQGKPALLAAAYAVKTATFCALIVPAVALGGLLGGIGALVLGDMARMSFSVSMARRLGVRKQGVDLGVGLFALTAGFGTLALVRHFGAAWRVPPLLALVLASLLVLAVFAPLVWSAARSLWILRRG